ncbi:unnamed protein product [Miscanthus lutarioriparius]|uniref:Uncharacterized protein n=1 Tax=Miscanthus lutarioriparius TaxID=422564 RepID=A0A811RIB5_9POAL|nr:unnamed protein product [Miscanthus lutarioriparius]
MATPLPKSQGYLDKTGGHGAVRDENGWSRVFLRRWWRHFDRPGGFNALSGPHATASPHHYCAPPRDRDDVGLESVKKAFCSRLGVRQSDIKVVHHRSEDFLIDFMFPHHRDAAVAMEQLPVGSLDIRIKPWRMLPYGDHCDLHYHNESIIMHVVARASDLDYVDSRSLRRDDTRALCLWAWTHNPFDIPKLDLIEFPPDDYSQSTTQELKRHYGVIDDKRAPCDRHDLAPPDTRAHRRKDDDDDDDADAATTRAAIRASGSSAAYPARRPGIASGSAQSLGMAGDTIDPLQLVIIADTSMQFRTAHEPGIPTTRRGNHVVLITCREHCGTLAGSRHHATSKPVIATPEASYAEHLGDACAGGALQARCRLRPVSTSGARQPQAMSGLCDRQTGHGDPGSGGRYADADQRSGLLTDPMVRAVMALCVLDDAAVTDDPRA